MKCFLKFILNCLAVLVGVATIISGYGGMINPLRSTLPAIIALCFPACLIATILIFIIGLFYSRKASLLTGVSMLLTAGPIWGFCPLNISHSNEIDSDSSLTVMTYNVLQLCDYADNNLPKAKNPTIRFITESDADIVALQECPTFKRAMSHKIASTLLDSLYARFPYRTSGAEGQALLSRFPFRELKLSRKPTSEFQVRAYRLSLPTGDITLFNLHLKSIGLTDNDKQLYRQFTDGEAVGKPIKSELSRLRHGPISKLSAAFRERAKQAQLVKEMIDSIGGTTIVCGDFNDIPGSYAARTILSAGLDDAYRRAGFGPAISYHASRFFFRIDQIFASPELKPIEAEVIKTPHSDHYPVKAVFRRVNVSE